MTVEEKLDKIMQDMTNLLAKCDKIDTLEQRFNIFETQLNEVKQTSLVVQSIQKNVAEISQGVSTANNEICRLNLEVESLQRAQAAHQVIVENVPCCPNEDLAAIIKKLLSSINVTESFFPLDAYRLGKPNPARTRPPPILLEFASVHVRDAVMKCWKEKKMLFSNQICPNNANFGLKNPGDRTMIYMNKNFSPKIRNLMKEARRLKRYGYRIVYEFANNVYVKDNFVDNPIKIIDASTVNSIIAKM
jgi:hypothetical protein